jgi:hypothetical protein
VGQAEQNNKTMKTKSWNMKNRPLNLSIKGAEIDLKTPEKHQGDQPQLNPNWDRNSKQGVFLRSRINPVMIPAVSSPIAMGMKNSRQIKPETTMRSGTTIWLSVESSIENPKIFFL